MPTENRSFERKRFLDSRIFRIPVRSVVCKIILPLVAKILHWLEKNAIQEVMFNWNIFLCCQIKSNAEYIELLSKYFVFELGYSWLSVVPIKFMQPAWKLLTKCGPYKMLAYLLYGSVARSLRQVATLRHGHMARRFAPAFRALGVCEHSWRRNNKNPTNYKGPHL